MKTISPSGTAQANSSTTASGAALSVAPTIAETDVAGANNAEAIIQGITRFMRPINYLGLPALVVPVGFGAHGMPVGLQIVGRPFNDEHLAALGIAFQGVTDFHKKAPVLR